MLANHVGCRFEQGMLEDIRDNRQDGDIAVFCESCNGLVGFISDCEEEASIRQNAFPNI